MSVEDSNIDPMISSVGMAKNTENEKGRQEEKGSEEVAISYEERVETNTISTSIEGEEDGNGDEDEVEEEDMEEEDGEEDEEDDDEDLEEEELEGEEEIEEDDEDMDMIEEPKDVRRKIPIKYIENKTRRQVTFAKRRHGIMKKAYELSVLTGSNILLLILSNSGLVYTFSTPKLEPIIRDSEGKELIRTCLNN